MMAPKPTRMYPEGPTRLFSTERFLGGVPYSGGELKGFAGMFVYAQCRLDVHRVLFSMALACGDWICRDCQSAWRRAEAGLNAHQGGA